MKNIFKTLLIVTLCLSVFGVIGCDSRIKPTLVESTEEWDIYEVHYEYKQEIWNDPETQSEPRVQFFWTPPGRDEEEYSIWSMRLDGTDLREAVSPELLNSIPYEGIDMNFKAPRSPSGRYIAFAASPPGTFVLDRRIIDLKEQKVIAIPGQYGVANAEFKWLNEHILLFHGTTSLVQYDVRTGETTDLTKVEGFKDHTKTLVNFFPRNNGKELLLLVSGGSWGTEDDYGYLYDFESRKVIKKIDSMPHWIYSLSADGEYWIAGPKKKQKGFPLGGVRLYPFDDPVNAIGEFSDNLRISTKVIDDKDTLYAAGLGLAVSKLGQKKKVAYSMPGKNRRYYSASYYYLNK